MLRLLNSSIRKYLLGIITLGVYASAFPYSLVVCNLIGDDQTNIQSVILQSENADGSTEKLQVINDACSVYSNFDGTTPVTISALDVNGNPLFSSNISFNVNTDENWDDAKSSVVAYVDYKNIKTSTLDTFNLNNGTKWGTACYMRGMGSYYGDDHGVAFGDEGNMEWLTAYNPGAAWNDCVGMPNDPVCPFHLSPGMTPTDMFPDANDLTQPGTLNCLTDTMGTMLTKLPAPLNYFTTWQRNQGDDGVVWNYFMTSPQTVVQQFSPPFIILGHVDDASDHEQDHQEWGQSKYEGYIDGHDLENSVGSNTYIQLTKSVALSTAVPPVPSLCHDYAQKVLNFAGASSINMNVSGPFDAGCTASVYGAFNNSSVSNAQNGWVSLYNFGGDDACSLVSSFTFALQVLSCQDPSPYDHFSGSVLTATALGSASGLLYFYLHYDNNQTAPYNNVIMLPAGEITKGTAFGNVVGDVSGGAHGCLNGLDDKTRFCLVESAAHY